jgi:hypothetical protein
MLPHLNLPDSAILREVGVAPSPECRRGNVAGKKFNDDVADIFRRKCTVLVAPVMHGDSGDVLRIDIQFYVRTNPLKAAQIIYPQVDVDVMFALQLSCQTPADTDVAVVVDDLTK